MSDTYFCEIETNLRFCEKTLSDEELVMRSGSGFSDRCAVCGRKIKSEEIGYIHPLTLEDVCKECWNLL